MIHAFQPNLLLIVLASILAVTDDVAPLDLPEVSPNGEAAAQSVAPESVPDQRFPLKFETGAADSPLKPGYSPYSRPLSLRAANVPKELGVDPLETSIEFEPQPGKAQEFRLLLTRSGEGEPYSKLYVDTDGNKQFDEPPIEAIVKRYPQGLDSRFDVAFLIHHAAEPPQDDLYTGILWVTVDADSDVPDRLHFTRRSFKTAEVTIDGKQVAIVLSDSNNDAILEAGDWWQLTSSAPQTDPSDMRKVGDFAWLDDQHAYQLELHDTAGQAGTLVLHDPGITREEDNLARDPYREDRIAKRAEQPLEFRSDYEQAMRDAEEKGRACFVKFETSWCGPCHLMAQLVFTAEDVVNAATNIECVLVDAEEQEELAERFKVTSYPTGVLLAPDGTEIGRFVGYRGVAEMTAFLQRANEKPTAP